MLNEKFRRPANTNWRFAGGIRFRGTSLTAGRSPGVGLAAARHSHTRERFADGKKITAGWGGSMRLWPVRLARHIG